MKTNKAKFGSVSNGTLRTGDLLAAFANELDWQIRRNGDFYSSPENFQERYRLNAIVEEANDCFGKDGQTIADDKQDDSYEMVNDTLPSALQEFAPACSYFGSHCGDGADFGFWPDDIEQIKEQVEFVSAKDNEYPADDFRGEWLHVNERGNCTLYVRGEIADADGNCKVNDTEIWSLV